MKFLIVMAGLLIGYTFVYVGLSYVLQGGWILGA